MVLFKYLLNAYPALNNFELESVATPYGECMEININTLDELLKLKELLQQPLILHYDDRTSCRMGLQY